MIENTIDRFFKKDTKDKRIVPDSKEVNGDVELLGDSKMCELDERSVSRFPVMR